MITVPNEVARLVVFNHIHPVTAWRNYFNMSTKELANLVNMSSFDIEKIESSNLHLRADIAQKLALAFRIDPSAIQVRLNNFDS